jgi:hypothetical protein
VSEEPIQIVVTRTVYFGGDDHRYFVDVLSGERDRHRLFFRPRTREGDRDRAVDLAREVRYSEEGLADYRRSLSWRTPERVPESRHGSFAAFLTVIGYDWGRNRYRSCALPETSGPVSG